MFESQYPHHQSQITLAALLREQQRKWSWNKCREVIASGRVSVGGEIIRDPVRRFPPGTVVEVSSAAPAPHADPATFPDIHVYHHDSHLIVVEKPPGIDSVPFTTRDAARHHDQPATLVDLARRWLESQARKKLPPLRVVHRIDKGTSGILVFARTAAAEKELATQFHQHSVQRRYVAICAGKVSSGTIRSVIAPDRGDGYRGSIHNKAAGKEAITHVKCLESCEDSRGQWHSLVECRLETGRTHQIRIHLCEAGHPLCGDKVYRRPRRGDADRPDDSGASRLALHAAELGFFHPVSSKEMIFKSVFPEDLARCWKSLGGRTTP